MKLRAITLENVRRFTDPVRIDGISDGLNILSEPNEFGKSTVFDAIQALFFKPHGSRDREIAALRPHAGGAPQITIEVETDAGRFVIAKRWFSKPTATVHQSGRLIAQSDEAEAWIADLLGGGDGGPSGLIWVRQGLTDLATGSKKELDLALEARRDLMTSVGEALEEMTGGRRMDMALARCREELDGYATGRNRTPKKGGPWRLAQERVETLEASHEALQQTARALHDALSERARARRALAELDAPEAVQDRAQKLEQARNAHRAAERHAEEMERVVRRVERAQAEVIAVENRLTTLREALAERQEAQTLAQTADAAARAARATHEARQQEKEAQDTTLAEASAALAAADEEQRAALRAEAARDGAERRAELIQRITDAEAARVRQENAAAAAKIGPDAAALARLDRLSAELGAAIAARNATATQIVARYEAGHEGMMRLEEGATLPDAEALPVPHVARVIIDGIGTLEIRPGASESGADAVERATEALAKTLAGLGADTLEAARSAARSRDEARRTEAEETAVLRSLAPEGIETLRERLARIPTPEDSVEAPDLASAEATLTSARSAHDHARALSDAATERLSDARAIAARCDADSTSAHERLSRAKSAAERLGEITEETLSQQMTDATQALEAAEALARAKAEGAPDLEAAQATLSRLEAVDTQARNEIARLRPLLATLDERIARASGDAVEERLAETAETLESARAELARIDREVAVLKRLEAALDAARSQARDRYFTPVANELKPLLRLLWPEAEMTWGHDTLLPEALIRDGAHEPVEILSGGTQEQVSLLVRLAFARMLAASGRSAPVILDDALVFTDDDRIVRMFDALHRQAGDLQILVLSCRQRAFRDLGGNTLRLGSA